MAKHYVCDNPQCGCTFQIEEVDLYCDECKPLSYAWNSEQKAKMAENAEQFAKNMMKDRAEFFAARTPKTRAAKPQEAGAVMRGGRGRSKGT